MEEAYRLGYVRPTLTGPTVEEQVERLKAAGVGSDRAIWQDAKPREWVQRDFGVKACREGDVFVVCSLWLLGANRQDVTEQVRGIVRRGGTLEVLDGGTLHGIDGAAMLGELQLAEEAWRKEQTAPATRRRKKKGKLGGRPPKLTTEQIGQALKWQEDDDLTLSEIAERFADQGVNIGRSTVAAAIKRHLSGQSE